MASTPAPPKNAAKDPAGPLKENRPPPPPPPQNQPNAAAVQDPMKDIRVGFRFESTSYKYRMEELIGDGGYGRVFEAAATTKNEPKDVKRLAVKIEPRTTSTSIEAQVLQTALERSCKRIPVLYDHGTIEGRSHSFIAMERKGRDLYQLRKERADGKFTLGTAVRTGIETLEALRELHEICGFISRDIKPGNFVTGPTTTEDLHNVYLVDFGLCRRYKDANNRIIASRGEVGWRGTNRYGSLQAHRRQDLSRKDDVESWFYMLVELTKGALPWATLRERDEIFRRKQDARNNTRDFLNGCPADFENLLSSIDALQFGEAPNYTEMTATLEAILRTHQIDRRGPMDWERDDVDDSPGSTEALTDSVGTPTTPQWRV